MARLQGHDAPGVHSGVSSTTGRSWHRQGKIAPSARGGLLTGNLSECSLKAKHKVAALTFSAGWWVVAGRQFFSPKPDRLTLFAYPSGKEHRVFTGHDNVVMATAFHPSGQWVASGGGEQKEILLWHAHTGETLSRLAGRGRTVYAVGFSPDGRYVSWEHTAGSAASHTQERLAYQFDLAQLVLLPGGLPEAAAVRAQERVGRTEAGHGSGWTQQLPLPSPYTAS